MEVFAQCVLKWTTFDNLGLAPTINDLFCYCVLTLRGTGLRVSVNTGR